MFRSITRRWLAGIVIAVALLALIPALLASAARPVLSLNMGLTLTQGASVTVTSAMLRISDSDTAPNDIRYRLTNLPTHGLLRLAGTPLAAGATFSQGDIDGGRLSYQHDGKDFADDVFGFAASDGPVPNIERISVASNGAQVGYDVAPSVSADGRYVAFLSRNPTIDPRCANGYSQVFVRDRDSNTTACVSLTADGTAANYNVESPRISGNGRFVVFNTEASNLASGDSQYSNDIFVRDLQSGTVELISAAQTGGTPTGASSYPEISGDGRYVVFQSSANNLVGVSGEQIYLRDRQDGVTELMSGYVYAAFGIDNSANRAAVGASTSADGRYVAFFSDATNLVAGDTNNSYDVFVRDSLSNNTTRLSISKSREQGNADSGWPHISPDGRYIAFLSYASNLVDNDTNNTSDVFLVDRVTQQISRVSINSNGTQADFGSGPYPVPSENGDYVAFHSYATTLVDQDTNRVNDIFVSDRTTGKTIRVSVAPDGTQATGESFNPSISNDGSTIAFASKASNLAPDDTNNNYDVFVSDARTVTGSFAIKIAPAPWLIMLYLAGNDNGTLGEPINRLIGRLAVMPFNPNLRLVVLKDGTDENDTEVFRRDASFPVGLTPVTPDASRWPNYRKELDTGKVSTLQDFMRWAKSLYEGAPSQYAMLSIVDHGGGWAPDFDDSGQPRGAAMVNAGGWRGMSMDLSSNSSLSTRNTAEALAGQGHLDLIFFDACLMGMVESAYAVQPYADYLITGENVLWAQLRYDKYFDPAVLTATTTPRDFAQSIVLHYNKPDSNEPPLNDSEPFTLAALDLNELRPATPNNLPAQVDALAKALLNVLPSSTVSDANPLLQELRRIYSSVQKFDYDNSFAIDPTDGYVDLADFAHRLSETSNPAVTPSIKAAATAVADTITKQVVVGPVRRESGTIVSERSGRQTWDFSGANGLSIFLPLGEQDWRPTKTDRSRPNSPALPERQLGYYRQLAFAQVGGAPNWAELLLRLEPSVTNIRTGSNASTSELKAVMPRNTTIDTRPFFTPAQVVQLAAQSNIVYLPLTQR